MRAGRLRVYVTYGETSLTLKQGGISCRDYGRARVRVLGVAPGLLGPQPEKFRPKGESPISKAIGFEIRWKIGSRRKMNLVVSTQRGLNSQQIALLMQRAFQMIARTEALSESESDL